MRPFSRLLSIALFLLTFLTFAQQPERKKIKITGKVVEKISKQPLEYATITLINTKNPKAVFGGITSANGEFSVDANAGMYDVKIEFISFKSTELKAQKLTEDTNLGTISLEEDATQLNAVEVRAEKTTVEIKLDKKVYNVGKDLMVKGGTVSDVLDNIPSVTVDAEGTVALRGNENVRILVDGRPSNAINITEALKLIPADAIDKVEVITNPSARYDAEGGGGILNIVLKKGKTNGLNGTFIATTGYPDNHGLSGTLNYKMDNFNLFTTQGYNYRDNPGNGLFDSEYLYDDNTTKSYVYETRKNQRLGKGYNGNFGFDWFLTKDITWSNAFNYRRNNGDNVDNVYQDYLDASNVFDFSRSRISSEDSFSENTEFTSSFLKKFKKDGHKLSIDASFSRNSDDNTASIVDTKTNNATVGFDQSFNVQKQSKDLIQTDYVLPFGKNNQLELGYRGDFNELLTDFSVINDGLANNDFTDVIQYKEKINALYSQFGKKFNKLSVLVGLRWEDSNIDINSLQKSTFINKKYDNFFPSAFLTYELKNNSSASISYSRRIQRPRGRQLIPFNNISSNINIFQGNPDINPAMTDAIDLGYMKKWDKLTFSSSLYVNKTTDVFQFVRKNSGKFTSDEIAIITATPINLATEYRAGFEFTLNYSPYKWWRLNSNFNYFNIDTKGDYTYTDFLGKVVNQNFDNKTSSWFARINSKVTLPYKIDWQTNANYNGPQNNAQGRVYGNFSANLAFSKDVLKDKGTIALNVNDVFNSRKRIFDTYISGSVDSYTEMQWRERQITLSFTYRINRAKNEKEKQPKKQQQEDNGGEGF